MSRNDKHQSQSKISRILAGVRKNSYRPRDKNMEINCIMNKEGISAIEKYERAKAKVEGMEERAR